MDTPILLIAWRRPHSLKQVIDAIRPVEPSLVFVACDGPNPYRYAEAEKVARTRAIVDKEIDWPCQIERLYSDVNQGCRLGVIAAITWFFQHVDEGIILEDDCVPHPDFFSYCSTLLERYRHDSRVWCISGNNFQNGQWRGNGSYYFSHYTHIWGWASWRQCWQSYDAELSQWPSLRDSGMLNTIFDDPLERKYWSRIWQQLITTGEPDTWDYQWLFSCLSNGGLTALPNRNLVVNVGFGEDATHATHANNQPLLASKGLSHICHPTFVLRDKEADQYFFRNQLISLRFRISCIIELTQKVFSRLCIK